MWLGGEMLVNLARQSSAPQHKYIIQSYVSLCSCVGNTISAASYGGYIEVIDFEQQSLENTFSISYNFILYKVTLPTE